MSLASGSRGAKSTSMTTPCPSCMGHRPGVGPDRRFVHPRLDRGFRRSHGDESRTQPDVPVARGCIGDLEAKVREATQPHVFGLHARQRLHRVAVALRLPLLVNREPLRLPRRQRSPRQHPEVGADDLRDPAPAAPRCRAAINLSPVPTGRASRRRPVWRPPPASARRHRGRRGGAGRSWRWCPAEARGWLGVGCHQK